VKRLLFVALVALGRVATAPAAEGDAVASVPEERIVQRTPVRGGGSTIGEVRLTRRGDENVVQTVLRTALLRRVIGEIRDKELANWPPDRAGHKDALAYIKALTESQSELAQRARRRAGRRDRRLRLLIEFSSSPSAVSVTLWDIDVEARGGTFQVTERRPLRSVPVKRAYVDRNMRLILADSFRVSEEEAAVWLRR
jgi:hypothetical protein